MFTYLFLLLMNQLVPPAAPSLSPALAAYVAARQAEFDQIPAERREKLQPLVAYLREKRAAQAPVQLTFICTHNSRRSQFAQVWGAISGYEYGYSALSTYSGGIEVTACNPRTVGAMKRAGIEVFMMLHKDSTNPFYSYHTGTQGAPTGDLFSKTYDTETNPQAGFCAIMTCSDADEACPAVRGAEKRISLPYEDPKKSDGTPEEAATYDARQAQIARELLWAFSEASR
jgi:arsenate reductase (thioredoxin)